MCYPPGNVAQEILSPVASRVQNADGSFTLTSSSGPLWYQNDSAIWTPVVWGSDKNLPGNCEFVPQVGGYRVWRPNGKPPYNPEWLPTDYWLQVEDLNGVTDFAPQRCMVSEQAVLANAGAKRPQWKWTWNDNLTYKGVVKGKHTWIDSLTNEVVFQKFEPRAWSKLDVARDNVVSGTATVDGDGLVAVSIDLTGLSYPVVLDPTSTFNPSAGDGYVRNNAASGSWATTIGAADGTSAVYTDTEGSNPVVQFANAGSASLCGRHFEAYDTSSLPDNAIISAATITKYLNDLAAANPDSQSYNYFEGTQASTTELAVEDYNNHGTAAWATAKAYTDLTLAVSPAWTANIWTLNATGIAGISKTGFTKFCLRASADYDAVAPSSGSNNYFRSANSEDANPPVLSVTYTLPSGVPYPERNPSAKRALGLP